MKAPGLAAVGMHDDELDLPDTLGMTLLTAGTTVGARGVQPPRRRLLGATPPP